jgi:hypothetical protein
MSKRIGVMGPLFFWSEAIGRTEEEQRAAYAAGVEYAPTSVPLTLDVEVLRDYNEHRKRDSADDVVWRKNEGTTNMLPNDPIGDAIGREPRYDAELLSESK